MDNTVVGSINNTPIRAKTAAGAAYVRKACHPPSPLDSAYEGRPDCSAPNVVMMELKSEANFAPILTLAKSATIATTINPSSMLFLQPPGAYVGNYVFMLTNDWTGPVTTGWVQPVNTAAATGVPAINQFNPPANLMNGYNFDNWTLDVARHRVTYKSSTYYLNATDFNNQGTVTTAKIRPNTAFTATTATLLKEHQDDPVSTKNLKSVIKGLVDSHNINTKGNERFRTSEDGYDILDSVGAPMTNFLFQILEFGPNSGNINSQNIQGLSVLTSCLPTTASELLVQSPKSVTRPAKEGAFVVLQQAEPTLSWIDTQDNVIASAGTGASQSGLPRTLIRVRTYSGNVWAWQYGYLHAGRITDQVYATMNAIDTIWDGLDWSLTLFEGLTVPTTTGTTLSSVPYITVKTIVGIELVPQLKSSLQCFSRTLPMPDQDAIDMMVGIMHARSDSLPASANDLGSIAKVAIRYLPDAIDWLKNLFGSKKEQTRAIEAMKPTHKTVKTTKSATATAIKPQPQKKSLEHKMLNDIAAKMDKLMVRTKLPSKLPSYSNSTSFSAKKTMKKSTKPHRRSN